MTVAKIPTPGATLAPLKQLPYAAVLVPYLSQARGFGPPGLAQFNTIDEREAFFGGIVGALRLAGAGANIDNPPVPLTYYVASYDNMVERERGYLDQIRGCPFPPWIWGGRGVMMRPSLTGVGGLSVGADPGPMDSLGTLYLASLVGGAWSPWTIAGPMPLGRLTQALDVTKRALKSAGIQQAAIGIVVQGQPQLSSAAVVTL